MKDAVLITSKHGDITRKDISDVCAAVGILRGDIVMVHARLFTLGRVAQGVGKDELADAFINALLHAVGRKGVVIFPTFTLSVCKSCLFDVRQTKSEMGLLSERARTRYECSRTHHPFFSVSILGDRKELFRSASLTTCFGKNSLFDVLHNLNETEGYKGKVKFITFGITLPPEAITFIHSIEEKFSVPYRYHKNFKGIIRTDHKEAKYDVQYFVRDLTKEVLFDTDSCWNHLKTNDEIKTKALGDSVVAMLPEAVIFSLISKKLSQQRDFLCRGGYKK